MALVHSNKSNQENNKKKNNPFRDISTFETFNFQLRTATTIAYKKR